MSLDCLNNIVGLSNTECNCWDDGKPVDYNTSLSGLYISQPDTIPLRWTGGSADCENGGVWDLLAQAREQAIYDLLKDFLAAVQMSRTNQFIPFTTIGDSYYKKGQTLTTPSNAAGAFIEPYCIKGAKLTIRGAKIAFWAGIGASTDVDINLVSSRDVTNILATGTATVTANKQYFDADFATPYVVDLDDIRRDISERYYLTYTLPLGAVPVSNDSEIRACCGSSRYEKNPYLQIIGTIGGAQGASESGLITDASANYSTMQGLVIKASMECDYYSWLCTLAQQPNQDVTVLDGGRLQLGMALADGIRSKAVANLANSILMGNRINEFSMIQDPKKLYHIRGHHLKIYQAAIDNLAYYMPADVTDCLVCNNDKRIKKVPILA